MANKSHSLRGLLSVLVLSTSLATGQSRNPTTMPLPALECSVWPSTVVLGEPVVLTIRFRNTASEDCSFPNMRAGVPGTHAPRFTVEVRAPGGQLLLEQENSWDGPDASWAFGHLSPGRSAIFEVVVPWRQLPEHTTVSSANAEPINARLTLRIPTPFRRARTHDKAAFLEATAPVRIVPPSAQDRARIELLRRALRPNPIYVPVKLVEPDAQRYLEAYPDSKHAPLVEALLLEHRLAPEQLRGLASADPETRLATLRQLESKVQAFLRKHPDFLRNDNLRVRMALAAGHARAVAPADAADLTARLEALERDLPQDGDAVQNLRITLKKLRGERAQ